MIYIDGDKYEILENIGNNLSAEDICIITGGNYDYKFLELKTSAGGLWYSEDIYSFKSGMPEKVTFDCGEANSIRLKNNIFYCEIKRNGTYPFVLCGDGVFRQLGREKLTREDFEARVKNGGEYLDSLAKSGETITEIYTYGHYSYELCGEDFCYMLNNVFGGNRLNYVPEEMRFTYEVIY
ncbi:MAG: hypothetical protein K2K44_02750, partial [Oscillospiraceae bacterium]|nr:hypothetical protein [Oscillospiraceae bacterium]